MFLIEDQNFLEKKHKDHIDNVILEDSFPWFFNKVSVYPNKLSTPKNDAAIWHPPLQIFLKLPGH